MTEGHQRVFRSNPTDRHAPAVERTIPDATVLMKSGPRRSSRSRGQAGKGLDEAVLSPLSRLDSDGESVLRSEPEGVSGGKMRGHRLGRQPEPWDQRAHDSAQRFRKA